MNKSIARATAVLLSLGVPTVQAAAIPAAQAAAIRSACADDVKHFCSGVKRGGGRIKQCLIDNRDNLSESCRDALGRVLDKSNS